jgi:microcompartment protein CcmL/EutN
MNKIGFKEGNYVKTSNSIHYEKIVVRNLLKVIPREESKLSSILAADEVSEFSEYEEVSEEPKKTLEQAKKELNNVQTPEPIKAEDPEVKTAESEIKSFF